jgi:hypothetical protein
VATATDDILDTLARFCDPYRDTGRGQMARPFVRDGWVYATNSRAVVRIAADKVAGPVNADGPPAERLGWWKLFPLTGGTALAGLPIPADVECGDCKGTGKTEMVTCPECDGDGEVSWYGDYSGHSYEDECQFCDGEGEVTANKVKRGRPEAVGSAECEDCHGTGRLPSKAPVEFGGMQFAADQLRLVVSLPGVVGVTHIDGGPKLLFTAGDIEGVLIGLL